MRSVPLVLGLALAAVCAHAADRPTYESMWRAANADPSHQTTDGGNAIVVNVPNEHAIYYFSKPGTPVHPGVIKRTVVEKKDGIYLQTDGWSFAPDDAQAAFKSWLQAFRDQAAEIQQRMSAQGHANH